MTSGEHFTILITVIPLFMVGIGAVLWWLIRRYIERNDDYQADVDLLKLEVSRLGGSPHRMERLELALTKLADIVTQMGLTQSRHEGWHDAHDGVAPPPMLG